MNATAARMWIGMTCAASLVTACGAETAEPQQAIATGFAIEEPKDGVHVTGPKIPVRGRHQQMKEDIWVFVCPGLAPGKCWPQSPDPDRGVPAQKPSDKGWIASAELGGPPQSYEIVAYTANKDASERVGKVLREWAQDAEKARKEKREPYPGLLIQDFPKGLLERQRVRIIRDK